MNDVEFELVHQALMRLRGLAESAWRQSRPTHASPVPELYAVICEGLMRDRKATRADQPAADTEDEKPDVTEDSKPLDPEIMDILPDGTQAFCVADNCFDLIRYEPIPGIWNQQTRDWDMLGAVPEGCIAIAKLTRPLLDTVMYLINAQAPTDRCQGVNYWDCETAIWLALALKDAKALASGMVFVQPQGQVLFTTQAGRETRSVLISNGLKLRDALSQRYRSDEVQDIWSQDLDVTPGTIGVAVDLLRHGVPIAESGDAFKKVNPTRK